MTAQFPIPYWLDQVAVVPVFVNTGAALLPALIAGLASFVTILFRPRQLVRVCREKPLRPLGVLVGIVVIGMLCMWLVPDGEAQGRSSADSEFGTGAPRAMMSPDDWVRLARELATGPRAGRDERNGTPVETAAADGPIYFRVNAGRSGYMGGPSPLKLTERWTYSEDYAMFWSTPVVRGDRVYAAWCMLDPPENFGAVVCIDANTGQRVWESAMRDADRDFGGFFSSPALTADGKALVIGQGLHPDYDSELVCIDTGTGRVRWLVDCPLHIESSPAIDGDIVVVGAGAVEDPDSHQPKPNQDPEKDRNPGYVFAVRISTGEVLWRHTVEDPESSPATEDGVVYIGSGFNGNAVVALRLEGTDGELKADGLQREIWRTPTPHPATGAITLAGDLVLVGCGNGDYIFQAQDPAGAVLALDRETGKVLWTQATADGVLGPIAARDQVAVVPVRNGEVLALDLATADSPARILWNTTAREGARALAGPALTDSHAYVVSHDGFLIVLDAQSGAVLESTYINKDPGEMGMSISSPVVAGGRIYVGSETGGLRCYEGGN